MSRLLLIITLCLTLIVTSCAPAAPSPTPPPTATEQVVPTATAAPTAQTTPKALTTKTPAANTTAAVDPETILQRVAGLRKLSIKSKVPVGYLKRDELRSYMIKEFDEENAPEDLAKEKALYVALGLLDQKDDLKAIWIDLLTEQVLGFYDTKKHQMEIIGDAGAMSTLDELTLAHEYTHALQDQNFEIGKHMEQLKNENDRAIAYQSLVEGDATLAMAMYAGRYKTPAELAEMQSSVSGVNMAKLNAAPYILQMEMLFPYNYGASLAGNLLQTKGGWPAIDAAFAKPPLTTEQVFHPDKYKADEPAKSVKLPDVAAALGSQWSVYDSNTFGELGWFAFLGNQKDSQGGNLGTSKTVENAALGWGGDHYMLLKNQDGSTALAALIEWDTPDDALEFHSATIGLLQAREGTKLTATEDRTVLWVSPLVQGSLSIKENQTLLVIAPNDGLVKQIVASFKGF